MKIKQIVKLVFIILVLKGCTYKTSNPKATEEINLGMVKQSVIVKAMNEFASENGFKVTDGFKNLNKSKDRDLIFLDLLHPEGVEIVVTDLRDGKRFLVAIHEEGSSNKWKLKWDKLNEKLQKAELVLKSN